MRFSEKEMKRLLSIQDISCFGRCSQTAALPIISALGIETVILPTAVLSTHTGGKFSGFTFHSLGDEMDKIICHWRKIGLKFDAIYAGYIGTVEQVRKVCALIDEFADNDTIVYIDPAMADNGELYSGLDSDYVMSVRELCSQADIISPNMSEAMLLADGKCSCDFSKENAKRLIPKLCGIADKLIVTGIHSGDNILTLGVGKNTKTVKSSKIIEGMFYGTGDVFASSFIGSYLDGLSFEEAIAFAEDFVQECIMNTLSEREKYWYGINYEKCLGTLTDFYKKAIRNDIPLGSESLNKHF